VSHTTLEEVFLNVTKQHNFVYSEDKEAAVEQYNVKKHEISKKGMLHVPVPDIESFPEPIRRDKHDTHPYRALIRKNIALQKRQTGTNICQVSITEISRKLTEISDNYTHPRDGYSLVTSTHHQE
jgi:hypothetical protein